MYDAENRCYKMDSFVISPAWLLLQNRTLQPGIYWTGFRNLYHHMEEKGTTFSIKLSACCKKRLSNLTFNFILLSILYLIIHTRLAQDSIFNSCAMHVPFPSCKDLEYVPAHCVRAVRRRQKNKGFVESCMTQLPFICEGMYTFIFNNQCICNV